MSEQAIADLIRKALRESPSLAVFRQRMHRLAMRHGSRVVTRLALAIASGETV